VNKLVRTFACGIVALGALAIGSLPASAQTLARPGIELPIGCGSLCFPCTYQRPEQISVPPADTTTLVTFKGLRYSGSGPDANVFTFDTSGVPEWRASVTQVGVRKDVCLKLTILQNGRLVAQGGPAIATPERPLQVDFVPQPGVEYTVAIEAPDGTTWQAGLGLAPRLSLKPEPR
jgi:hypothetical protein